MASNARVGKNKLNVLGNTALLVYEYMGLRVVLLEIHTCCIVLVQPRRVPQIRRIWVQWCTGPTSTSTAVRFRPINGGELPAKLAPLTSFMLLPHCLPVPPPSELVQAVAMGTPAVMHFHFLV